MIVGRNSERLGFMAAPPSENWDEVVAGATERLRSMLAEYKFARKKKANRRGPHKFVNVGLSYGGGQQKVQNIAQGSQHNAKVVAGALVDPAIRRVAGFVDATFQQVAPRVYNHYYDTLNTILEHDRTLVPNFDRNVFAAATFNLGPEVATVPHTDHMNYVSGWCAIVPFGNFNHHRGGHIVLWDLKLVIEFPPGTLIYIPSALIRHSNTAIGRGETRMSFTQFSAGGLFRWVDCGCQTQAAFEAAGGVLPEDGRTRWMKGLGRFDRWEDVVARGRAAFGRHKSS
ncbi:hypothetical protein OH76DRAFT_1366812 [Lentinus brumalis]|uniref:Fe2OG dioxygenase domain-containing protein n=1 Tax=Lentinus brumalis TaxID=2498619 RepID=A0A371CID0_9APHY|nr:hypothetical protein OH76DRAFT_1366812 [Polyporus brumalis]